MKQPSSNRPGHGEITPGVLLLDSYRTLMANLVPFLIIAFLCKLPIMIWDYHTFFVAAGESAPAAPQDNPFANLPMPDTEFYVRLLLILFLNTLSQAAMVYGTVQFFSGRKVPTDECISKGFSRLVPALGVAFVCSFLIGCGLLCFLIPGIVLTCILYLAVPVTVIEDLPLRKSCLRSIELTHGFRIVLGITIGMYLLLTGFTALCIGAIIGADAGVIGWAVQEAVFLLFAAIGSVLSAVAYIRLRERKDGVQSDDMIMIFE